MASQEQFNELQQLLQQQQKQVEELQARLNAQNDAGQGLQNQLAEEQRQRVLATDELTRATTALAEAQRGLREEREKAAAALSPGEQKLLTKPERFLSEKDKWKEWSKEFVSFLAAGNPQVREATALAASRRHGDPFSNEELALWGYIGVARVPTQCSRTRPEVWRTAWWRLQEETDSKLGDSWSKSMTRMRHRMRSMN